MEIDLSKIKPAASEAAKPARFRWTWGWRYIDASIVVMGVLIAVLVWFIPSMDQNKDLKEFLARQKEIHDFNAKVKAEEARKKKEEEDLGIIWVPPPKDLVVPKPA